MLSGLIFDLDGTLVDSNDLHVEAWRRALALRGYRFNTDRLHAEIGKGGDTLLPDLLGKQTDEEDGEFLREQQPKQFKIVTEERGGRVAVFDRAVELLRVARERGLKTVLATSSGKSQLETIEGYTKVKWSEQFDEIVNADDAETSKPAPDLVAAAVKKLKLSPAECAMIGDTIYDATSAKHAGVVCLGVTCGGNDEAKLKRGGCRRVWRDPSDILDHLDEALHIASPGSARLDVKTVERLMKLALENAERGMEQNEAPIGCILARGDGETILAGGFNELNKSQNRTAHAEIVTFAKAAGKAPLDARDLVLVSTLEPCVMCTGAAMESAVDTIIFGLRAPADSGTGRVDPPESPESQMPRIVPDVMRDESIKLFKRWLKRSDLNPQQREFGEQLLKLSEEKN